YPLRCLRPSMSLLHIARSTAHLYPLSLHDALPISHLVRPIVVMCDATQAGFYAADHDIDTRIGFALALCVNSHRAIRSFMRFAIDRKSTRLNSSHVKISYAVFCLQKQTSS